VEDGLAGLEEAMPKLKDYLASVPVSTSDLAGKLTATDLEYPGPEGDADYSKLACVWESLKTADEAIGEALDLLANTDD
jgi:hypothetical protein